MKAPITLEPFKIEPQEWMKTMYFFDLSKGLRGVALYLLVWIAVMTIFIPSGAFIFITIGPLFLLLVLTVRWVRMRQTTRDPFNRSVWQNRQVEFDDKEMKIAAADGTRSQIPIRNLIVCRELTNYYLLYLTRSHSFLISKAAFRVPGDEAAFRQVLFEHKLLTAPATK